MDEFLQRKPVLAIIAFILAAAVWASVSAQTNPIETKTFAQVPIHAVGTPAGKMSIFPQGASVTVSGPRSVLQGLSPDDIHLLVDTSGQANGTHQDPIAFKAPPGVGQAALSPKIVTVIISP